MRYADQARPDTASSRVSCSSLGSMSVGSSLNGAELAALVQRRSQIRSQMARVDRQLANVAPSACSATPPSTAPSGAVRGPLHPVGRGPPGTAGGGPRSQSLQAGCALDGGRPPAGSYQQRCSASAAAAPPPVVSAAAAPPRCAEPQLPSSLQPGRYAFFPKGLSSNAACQRSLAATRKAAAQPAVHASSGSRGGRAPVPARVGAAPFSRTFPAQDIGVANSCRYVTTPCALGVQGNVRAAS